MSEEEWQWELSSTAQDDLDAVSPSNQDRILDKLDEITSSPWRDPPDYGEPLQNSPYRKIRVGGFRLSVTFRQDECRYSLLESSDVVVRTQPTTTEQQEIFD